MSEKEYKKSSKKLEEVLEKKGLLDKFIEANFDYNFLKSEYQFFNNDDDWIDWIISLLCNL